MRVPLRILKAVAVLCVLTWIVDGFLLMRSESPRPVSPFNPNLTSRYVGAVHVHSLYSDGGGTVSTVVQAGQETGLDFIILTDHGTLQPRYDGYQKYYGDLLLLVGEEVNTSAGHLLSLGVGSHVEQQGPRGLNELLAKISNSGGLSIVAHPTGRRPWTDWSLEQFDGLELFNADTAWRDDHLGELARALVFLPFMPDEVFNSLVDRPQKAIRLWLKHSKRRQVTAIGSVDAHERIPLWGDRYLAFPSYERLFGLVRTYVITESQLTGKVDIDEEILLNALRLGNCYIVLEGYEPAPGFSFEIEMGEQTLSMGSRVEFRSGSRFQVSAPSSGPVKIILYRNGVSLAETEGHELLVEVPGPGIYHIETYQLRTQYRSGDRPRIWIISNAIRVE